MIVAMAGHVDHGKSALTRHLTGVEPDRLIEEKARGLTIDLGFSYLPLASGKVLGIVDVPGHEKFVTNMLAGVSIIDLAILVVAADDGPMPQTAEHLAILDLLSIPAGVVAITKSDRASEERLLEVEENVRRITAATFLAEAPIFRVSNTIGSGVAALRDHLVECAERHELHRRRGNFRLAIDRRFTVKGSGLVVTGAGFSGEIAVGDQVLVGPKKLPARVRAVHAQNRAAERAGAGERIALNLVGPDLGRASVARGDWAVAPRAHHLTDRIDASCKVLASETRPLRHDRRVHLHVGAFDVMARVAILNGRRIDPGETGLAQFKLDRPTIVVHGDRLVLRDEAGRSTIAGGTVLNPFAQARRRATPKRIATLEALGATDPRALFGRLLDEAEEGLDLTWFERTCNLTQQDARALLGEADFAQFVADGRPFALSRSRLDELIELIEATAEQRDLAGFTRKELQRTLAVRVPMPLLSSALYAMVDMGRLQSDGQTYGKVGLSNAEDEKRDELAGKLLSALRESGVPPDTVNIIARRTGLDLRHVVGFFNRAAAKGLVHRVTESRFFPPETLNDLAQAALEVAKASQDGWFRVTDFRDRTGIGRNPSIEILEHFDKIGFTRRVGDDRQIARVPEDRLEAAQTS